MLTKLIKAAYIQLDIEASSFEEAIELAMSPLVIDEVVTTDYVDKVIAILREIGPYIVITQNIAIPHAPSESGAKKLAIGFTRLKNAIVSGNSANDPVKFLFSLYKISISLSNSIKVCMISILSIRTLVSLSADKVTRYLDN